MGSIGRTSDLHAGQWNTPSGSLRISEWPPRASGNPTMSRRFSSAEPSSGKAQEPHPAAGHPVSRDLRRPLDVRGSNLHPAAEASLADLDGHAYHFGAHLFFASPLQLPERATTPGAGSFYQERYREIGWSGIGRKEDQGEEIHRRSERRHKITQRGFRFPSVVSLCRGRLEPDQPP
jgi:hypothetical protein